MSEIYYQPKYDIVPVLSDAIQGIADQIQLCESALIFVQQKDEQRTLRRYKRAAKRAHKIAIDAKRFIEKNQNYCADRDDGELIWVYPPDVFYRMIAYQDQFHAAEDDMLRDIDAVRAVAVQLKERWAA